MIPDPAFRILLVEDSEDDAQLLETHLRSQGLAFTLTRVDDLETLQRALEQPGWDILLTDFSLPGLDGLQVIGEAERLAPFLPCLLVSGQIGEDAAVESLRAGAKDFIPKHRLARLIPAMQREISEARLRSKAEAARAELRSSEGRFRAITSAALDGIVMMDPDGRISFWNQAAERIFGYPEAEALGMNLHDLLAPVRFHPMAHQGMGGFRTTGHGAAIGKVSELQARRKDGREFPVEISLAAIPEGDTWHAVGMVRDISARKLAEESIRRKEQRFRLLFEEAPLGMALIDSLTGHIFEVNDKFASIAGRTREQMADIDWMSITHPDDVQADLDLMARMNRGEINGFRMNKRYLRPGGSIVWISMTIARTQVEDPAHPRHLCMIEDITEHRAMERDQQEHLQFLRTLIETLPSPFYYEDIHGRIQGCNQAFQRFLGLSHAGILGKPAASLLFGQATEGSAGPAAELSGPGEIHGEAFQVVLPDGQVRHALFYRAPFLDADGCPSGCVATLLDITRIKEAEEALRQNESLFDTIHQHVVDLIAIIDANGRRIYTSPSYLFVLGYTEAEMQSMSSTDLLHPDDRERVANALSGLMEGHPTQGLEYRLRHKDGRWLHFESTAAIIPDQGTGAARALVVARDITARKDLEQNRSAMESQLRQAQKLEAIGQLAAGIAHEINTPTQYIGDNSTFLRDSFDEAFALMGRLMAHLEEIRAMGGPAGQAAGQALVELATTDLEYLGEEIPKAIQQSLDGVARISKIVSAMKDFSHPGSESKVLTDLHRAIESTVTVSRNEWKYVATLETDFDPALPAVPCYPGEFNQVILNMIVNAAHAIESFREGRPSGELGRITVKTRRHAAEAEIAITDDGTGIPLDIQHRLFEPFFTTKPVGKGTGQGLAIAYKVIVDKHGGRILLDSAPGRGTTFRIFLPLPGPDA